MNLGKLVLRHGELFVRDLSSDKYFHVDFLPEVKVGEYCSYEVNEDDSAVNLVAADKALLEFGVRASTGSFYVTLEDRETNVTDESESFVGLCDLTGVRGNLVPCLYLSTEGDGEVVQLNVGDWLVYSVLGKLAGAF